MGSGWYGESERHSEAALKGRGDRHSPLERTVLSIEKVDRQRTAPGVHWIWVKGTRYALISGPSLRISLRQFQKLRTRFEKEEPPGTIFKREGLVVKTKNEGYALYGAWIPVRKWVGTKMVPI